MSYTDKPKVFCDFHHASLLQSFILLFEKRLGGSVYRPIGMEWVDQGYWKVFDHPATQQQFLTLTQGYRPIDGTEPLNIVEKYEDGVYYCQDIDSGYYNKAIDLYTFFKLPIDIVIATLPQHIEPFKRLCETHPNKPKLIYQIGNAWTVDAGLAPNVMASAIISGVPENINFISYHQEFDLNKFKVPETTDALTHRKTITSLVNCFNIMGHFAEDWALFQKMETTMPDWKFTCLGGQCRDGAAHGSQEVADTINVSRFLWHTKNGGDGYGHIIFNAAAMGKPMIVKKQYYLGKLGEALFKDGETCICIDGLTPEEIKEKIEHYNEPENYLKLFYNVVDNFKREVNFDVEELYIRKFLEVLK